MKKNQANTLNQQVTKNRVIFGSKFSPAAQYFFLISKGFSLKKILKVSFIIKVI